MDKLTRYALGCLPMTEQEVREIYATPVRVRDSVPIGSLCESHERLRAELQGLQVLHDEAIAEVRVVLSQLDDLDKQWGDEEVFRRCRDRLRAVIGEGQK